MATLREQATAVVLVGAGRHFLRAREQQVAAVVVERARPLAVPAVPAGERLLGHLSVELIEPVIHADDFADVVRRAVGMRHDALIQHGDLPAARVESKGSREPEGSPADDHNGLLGHFPRAKAGATREPSRKRQRGISVWRPATGPVDSLRVESTAREDWLLSRKTL